MSLLATLAPHLPFLRRYARALTGDQATGDRFVRSTLQALADGEETLDASLAPRVALYRLFQERHRGGARPDAAGSSPATPLEAARSHLMRIAPVSRQAFLLTAMEGFTSSETAKILGVDFDQIDTLIQAAQRDIDEELATDRYSGAGRGTGSLCFWSRHNAGRGARRRRSSGARSRIGRHPVGRRFLGNRRRTGHPRRRFGAGDLHHRVS